MHEPWIRIDAVSFSSPCASYTSYSGTIVSQRNICEVQTPYSSKLIAELRCDISVVNILQCHVVH